MTQIFISYSHSDTEFADKLKENLEQKGYSVWIDHVNIQPGDIWDDEIIRGLKASEVFLVILSKKSTNSQNVKDEFGKAIDYQKQILPIQIENCEVPLRLSRIQYIDFTRITFEAGFQKVLSKLAKIEQNELAELPPEPTPLLDSSSGRHGRMEQLPLIILLVLLTVVIILGVLFLRTIPRALVITVSNETSIDIVKTFPPIQVTNATTVLGSLPVKGDSPVTVSIQALNLFGSEIPSEALVYDWKLCCNDKRNPTSDTGRLTSWEFEPPTDLANETLTVTVSNERGFSMEVVIPFTITIR